MNTRDERRAVFFTDSYLEVNGVANTSRRLAGWAREQGRPFLCIHAGPETARISEGSLERLALSRTNFGFRLDADLRFDLLIWRHARLTLKTVSDFAPDVIHITGPSDIGLLGLLIALRLKVPLVISWHTNIHEYARMRLEGLLVPLRLPAAAARLVERLSLWVVLTFYRTGKVLMAPNKELVEMLRSRTGRPTSVMWRGVDTELFSPAKRQRRDEALNIGYVGRLTPEKGVRLLERIEKGLLDRGFSRFLTTIVGTGSEIDWLRTMMVRANLTGVLRGEELAQAYANMDLFVFPSSSDTFGNAVLEAQASGVPVIVRRSGGPRFIIEEGRTGLIADDDDQFIEQIIELAGDPARRRTMALAARERARNMSWESMCEQVYRAYDECFGRSEPPSMSGGSGLTVGETLRDLRRDPVGRLLLRWNWKSAILSAVVRGSIFFATTISAGVGAASVAMARESTFYIVVAGLYGALVESFRHVRPVWKATITIMVLLPVVNHSLEFVMHRAAGTSNLATGMLVSICFSMISAAFNLHVMREGALIVGEGSRSLWHDLRSMPGIALRFLAMLPGILRTKR